MASTPSTVMTGESRKGSSIGKRSGKQLADLTPNPKPRRSKLIPDLHPGEQPVDESSASSLVPESSVSHLDEAPEEVLFDQDTEDLQDQDAVKAQEQARQFEDWPRNCERNDPLAHLGMDNHKREKSVPMTLAWWSFMLAMDTGKVLDRLMASLADPVKAILGGPMVGEELLMLPSQWEGCDLWGVYTNTFTSIVHGEVSRPDVARYCGSGTAKVPGLQSRLTSYERTSRGNINSELTCHGNWLVRTDVRMSLRVIAVVNQCDADQPYVLLKELLLTTLLQTLPMIASVHYRNVATLKMIQEATPLDLPEAKHDSLNGATHCLLYHSRTNTSD